MQYRGTISGPGNLTVMGGTAVNSGTNAYILELGSSNSYTGTTTINNAIVTFNDGYVANGPNNILPASTVLSLVNSGWFNFDNGASNQTIAGLSGDATGKLSTTNGASASVLTIDPAAGQSYTFGGVIGAQTLLNKTGNNSLLSVVIGGAGTEVLAGANTYTGSTSVTGGTLQVGNGATGSLATAGITVGNNTLLAYNIGTAQTYGGVIAGGGAVSVTGNQALVLTASNTFSGGLTIGGGTLSLGSFDTGTENTASLGTGTVGITGGGVLTLGGTTGASIFYTVGNNFTLNNGTILAEDDQHTFTGVTTIGAGGGTIYTQYQPVYVNNLTGSGALRIDSIFINAAAPGGIVYLGGSGGYTGTVTISQSGVAGAAAGHGGEMGVSTVAALENAAVVMSSTRGISFAVANPDFGSLSGSGGFALTTTAGVSAGTLTVGGINTNTTYTGVITGAGALLKTGSGLLALGGVNSYTGGTIVNGGTLQLNIGDAGPLAGGSTVIVNSGATLLGNATDPLNYNGGGYTAVNLVINDGTMYENAGVRATLTSLNMTGGTLTPAPGPGPTAITTP